MSGVTTIDWIIIALYFIGTILIAKLATKRVTNTSEYLIGGGKIGKFQSAISIASSDIGGSSLVGAAGLAYAYGLAGGWWNWCAVPAWFFLGKFLAGGFRKLALTTVPELLEKRYDKNIRLLAAILSLLSAMIAITVQVVVASLVFTTLTGLPEHYSTIIITIIFVAYTASGGLIAVIWTDIMHYFVLIAGIILTVIISIPLLGGWSHLVNSVPSSYWNIGNLGWSAPIGWIFMCFFIYCTTQQYIQRLFAAKDESTARFSCYFTGINYIIYGLLVALIGICGYILVPGLNDSQQVLPEMIRTALPVGLKGLVLAAILAATMNVSASMLNACTALFSIDIYKRFVNQNVDDKRLLHVSRIATVCIAFCSMAISYGLKNIVDLVVLCGLIYSAGVFFPILIGMNNKRVNSYGAISAMISGGIMALVSNFILYNKVQGFLGSLHPYIVGGIVSLAILLFISYLTPAPSKENLEFFDSINLNSDAIKNKLHNDK
ncbi:MAG: sodium:solute symporter [Clostridiaceae bacterium]